MVLVRNYSPEDLPALYDICLTTGASGQDASALHSDPELVGHIYAAPYAVLEPEHVLVAEDEAGVAGYIVGTFDSSAFAERLEREWWPGLRQRYARPVSALTEADRHRIASIRRPGQSPADIVSRFPAHVHMNLRTRLRGQGVGTTLLTRWTEVARTAGVAGIHLGANASNHGGIAFWQHSGFVPVKTVGSTVWMGMALP